MDVHEVGTPVWIPDEKEVWAAGEVVARGRDDGSGVVEVFVRPVNVAPSSSASSSSAAAAVTTLRVAVASSSSAPPAATSKGGLPVAAVLQRNVFSGGDADADAEDLIALPHLNEPAILEVRSRDHMTRRVTRRPPLCDATRPVQNAAPPRARALREEVDGSPLFCVPSCVHARVAWHVSFHGTPAARRVVARSTTSDSPSLRTTTTSRARSLLSRRPRCLLAHSSSPPLATARRPPPTPKPLLPGAPRARGTRPRLHAHRPDPARAQPMQGIFILVCKTLY